MAEAGLGVYGVVKALLRSAAAGYVFAEAALFAVQHALTEDDVLLAASTLAVDRAGTTGVAVVTACLVFTSALLSLGTGFLLTAMAMMLLTKVSVRVPWLVEATTGAAVVLGAVATGVLNGILPPWLYLGGQGVLLLVAYSYSNINDVTTALLIIFTTLYLSVVYGRIGVIAGFFSMGLTISVLCALGKRLTEGLTQRPTSQTGCKLLERIVFYSGVVGILGFFVGLGAGEARGGSEEEVILMLESVLWVTFLSAGVLGAGLGTVVMVGLGPKAAGKVAVGAAVVTSVALRVILQRSSSLGPRSSMGGALGAATAAGVALGAASVAAKQEFGSRNSTLVVLGSVVVGAVMAIKGQAAKSSESVTVCLVAVGAFVLGAPKSPFHTEVNMQRGLLMGAELIKAIGMETVTTAAAPIGAGALGAAALGTAALGRLGTVGVVVAIMLALGTALSGMIGKSPKQTHTKTD